MSDAEILNVIEAGQINLLFVCRNEQGQWDYYDRHGKVWREAQSFKDAFSKVWQKQAGKG